jgi:pyrimidine operon attenuation protein / uracil phosphoribosyltransferase
VSQKILFDHISLQITLQRLCHQLIEVHHQFENTVIIGLQPRGVLVARRIHEMLKQITGNQKIQYGELDITFYRDDFRQKGLIPAASTIHFNIENKNVVLIDDVLFTGRTIRAGLDALTDYGRANDIELLVLVDRRLSRHVPIQAKYAGRTVDTINSEKILVELDANGKTENDKVILVTQYASENKASQ